jgi:3-oxoacyl-[acyl-carrier protein] reductase
MWPEFLEATPSSKETMYMGRLEGKVAIVTGAGRGIGAEIARTFAREGADVVLASLIREEIDQVAEEVRHAGRAALPIQTDITVKVEIAIMVQRTHEEFGKIDILVNNAGTIRPAGFLKTTEEDWDAIQAVDLKGLFLCTQAVAPHMIRQRYGKIVNVSSMAANGWYMPGYASYCAAKAAVNNLTKYTARELGEYGINVNAVAPGEILTALTYQGQSTEEVEKKLKNSRDMTMVKRIGEPKDVASLVLFLASDESTFIVGETISVDGGRIDRM